MKTTEIIPDDQICLIWKNVSTGEEVGVGPDWFEKNGTPIDENGDDMAYVRTEVAKII